MNRATVTTSKQHQNAATETAARAASFQKDDTEDRDLVEKSLEGSLEAFEKLFQKYRQRLFGVVWKVLRNEDAALDIVQDAFVKAFERLDKLRGESSFYPWLRRIGVNLAIDRVRHIRRGVEVQFDEAQFGTGQEAGENRAPGRLGGRSEQENPLRKAQLSEFTTALGGALEKLSENQRVVFMLHAAESLTYKEIAETLDCNIGTVMSRLFYARKRLQELLANHLDLDEVGAGPEED